MNAPPFHQRAAMALFLGFKAFVRPLAFGAAAIVENQSGQVLLVRHSYMDGWSFPGGGVNRNEPPEDAVIRELREEIGLQSSAAPELFGLYTRKVGWTTNVVALYRVRAAKFEFKPNFEIRDVQFADPLSPPPGTTDGTRRRLAELKGAARTPYW